MQREHLEKFDFMKLNLRLYLLMEYLPLNVIDEYKKEHINK